MVNPHNKIYLWLHCFLILTLERDDCSTSRSGRFIQETRWAPGFGWTLCSSPSGIQTASHPVRSLLTIPTELSKLYNTIFLKPDYLLKQVPNAIYQYLGTTVATITNINSKIVLRH